MSVDEQRRDPPPVGSIVGSEAAERFSFYGLQSILTVYLLDHLLYGQGDTKALYHVFTMAVYLTPLVGGWLAGRYFGRYAITLWVSLGSVAGLAVLALWQTREGLLVGLGLVALGAGGLEPCVSAFVGDPLDPSQKRLLARASGWFFFSISLGSATSQLLVPYLLRTAGPAVAFAIPGAVMAVALLVFRLGRGRYVRVQPSGPNPHAFPKVVGTALKKAGTGRPGEHWLDAARARHPAEAVAGAKAVFRIGGVFAAVTFFRALFDQKGSSWVLQAKAMDLRIGDVEVAASQVQALNPFLLMALLPLFTLVVFPALERRGVPLGPLRKMTAGMFVTVLAFAAAALVQASLDAGATPHVLWQVPQYLLLTSGEVLVAVTALEFSSTQAPRSMRSTITSIWFVAIAAGNLLTALVSKLFFFPGAAYFWFFAALMLVAAVVFGLVTRRYRPAAPAVSGPEPLRAAAE